MTTDNANNEATGATGPSTPPDAEQPPVAKDAAHGAQPDPGKKDYAVGYKRPPRRIKGAIPNPKGRPRKFRPESFHEAMRALQKQKVKVPLPNGRFKKTTHLTYLIERIKQGVRQGDADALVQMRLLDKIVAKGNEMEQEGAKRGKLVVPAELSTEEWVAKYCRPLPAAPAVEPAGPQAELDAEVSSTPGAGEIVSQSAEEDRLADAKRRALEQANIKKAAHDRAWAEFGLGKTGPSPLPADLLGKWWEPETRHRARIDRATYEETWRLIIAARG